MFTLMPVAAFAATAYDFADGNSPAAGVPIYGYVDDADRVVGDATSTSTLYVTTNGAYIVYATDAAGKLAQIDALDVATANEGNQAVAGKAYVVNVANVSATTPGSMEVSFAAPGTYTLAMAPFKTTAQAVKVANANYDWTDGEVLTFLQGFTGVAMYNNTVKVGEVADDIAVVLTLDGVSVQADGGFSELTGKVQVTNKNFGVPNVDVNLYTDSYGLQVTKIDAKTNAAGIQTFRVTGTLSSGANSFNVYASYEGVTDNKPVQVTSLGPVAVKAISPAAPVAKNMPVGQSGVGFTFTDANGAATAPGTSGSAYKVTVLEAPTGYNKTGLYLSSSVDADNKYTIVGPALTLEGDYTFQVALKNGATATASVKVQKQGEPVGVIFVKAPKTVALGADNFDVLGTQPGSGVFVVDAAGVVSSPVTTVNFSVNGKAVEAFTTTDQTLDVKDDEKYVGSKITVLAVYNVNNKTFTATNELTVVDAAESIVYVVKDAETGVINNLVAQVQDSNGKFVELNTATAQAIVLEKPEGAVVTIAGANYVAGKGVIVNFLANTAGEYKVQTIVTYGTDKYVSSIDTIVVGGAEGTFKDVIVMSIGANSLVKNSEVVAMPAAPEIVDSRTMVPARAGLEAFGATVVWDEATQTVTAELGGVKVVMTIGEKVYTVNGKAVTGDAAPYITAASTMVPVSFFTNAFGITATPIYDANGVCDVLFTK